MDPVTLPHQAKLVIPFVTSSHRAKLALSFVTSSHLIHRYTRAKQFFPCDALRGQSLMFGRGLVSCVLMLTYNPCDVISV